MKAIELRDRLNEIFSNGKEYENYDVLMTGAVWSYDFNYDVDNLRVNEDSEFGKIIEIF